MTAGKDQPRDAWSVAYSSSESILKSGSVAVHRIDTQHISTYLCAGKRHLRDSCPCHKTGNREISLGHSVAQVRR